MIDPPILVCQCGRRLKAAGATPGRVGRCPSCGELLRVSTSEIPSLPQTQPQTTEAGQTSGYEVAPAKPTVFVGRSQPRLRERSASPTPKNWDGFLPVPERPESRNRTSLLYPLWGATGIALLVFAPPLLWFASLPFLSIPNAQVRDLRGLLVGLLALLPATMMFVPVACFILLFLGRVLVASALGESHHPRWPDWELGEMFRGLWRWIVALVAGGFFGGCPAVGYWIYCGDIDFFDAVILTELSALGIVYGQFALLASILHDDPLGANPVTVLRAIRRVGWACITPAAWIIGFGGFMAVVGKVVFLVDEPAISAFAYWLFWVVGLYAMMVVLRILGLFYHRYARVLGWFRDRPRWGV